MKKIKKREDSIIKVVKFFSGLKTNNSAIKDRGHSITKLSQNAPKLTPLPLVRFRSILVAPQTNVQNLTSKPSPTPSPPTPPLPSFTPPSTVTPPSLIANLDFRVLQPVLIKPSKYHRKYSLIFPQVHPNTNDNNY